MRIFSTKCVEDTVNNIKLFLHNTLPFNKKNSTNEMVIEMSRGYDL